MKAHLRLTIDDLRLKKGKGLLGSVMNRKTLLSCIAVLTVGIFCLAAQMPNLPEQPRKEYKFTFGRVYFESPMIWKFMGPIGAGDGPAWSHDWPRSEEHFMKIMAELTKLDVNPSPHIFSFQNDDCFKYPIAYLCEVGYMHLSPQESHRMAEYLLRGGFLIVDDFRTEYELNNFKNEMKKVFPDRPLQEVPRTHPIWTCFYDISRYFIDPPYSKFLTPQYFGISDDKGRLMMIVDYNNDISEYWEWSDNPLYPIDTSNEAYKYGVNYVVYALTH